MKKLIKIFLLIFCAFGFGAEEIAYVDTSEIDSKILNESKKSRKIGGFNNLELSLCDSHVSTTKNVLPRFLTIPNQEFCTSIKTGVKSQINFHSKHQLYLLFQQIIVYF
ncbi:MAG: hypothetical protein KBT58_01525 [Bizionia sp.]|nr:hypothetical protein [Bizionia sp.]